MEALTSTAKGRAGNTVDDTTVNEVTDHRLPLYQELMTNAQSQQLMIRMAANICLNLGLSLRPAHTP